MGKRVTAFKGRGEFHPLYSALSSPVLSIPRVFLSLEEGKIPPYKSCGGSHLKRSWKSWRLIPRGSWRWTEGGVVVVVAAAAAGVAIAVAAKEEAGAEPVAAGCCLANSRWQTRWAGDC